MYDLTYIDLAVTVTKNRDEKLGLASGEGVVGLGHSFFVLWRMCYVDECLQYWHLLTCEKWRLCVVRAGPSCGERDEDEVCW